jgi:hypothetical protein
MNDKNTYVWEMIELSSPKAPRPEPRSGFAGVGLTDPTTGLDRLFVFGGSGENNTKYNDLWEFDGTHWVEHKSTPDQSEEVPLEKSGHQMTLFKNQFLLVFGGIHEVTYEMNDLRMYNLQTKRWSIVDEENKATSDNGSP